MEFQAVIMAAGRGSRMTDLTAKTPKALLPIGNQPLIWYPIQLLERAGFEAAIVIVLDSFKDAIERVMVNICDVKMKLEFVGIPDDEDWGTADSLRHIGDKIKSDVMVVSCDLLTGLSLHLLADVHRTNDATVTMLLATNLEHTTDMVAPGTKSKKKLERDLIGLDEKESKVVFMSSEADFEEVVPIRKSLLKRQPCVNIHTNLMDAHLYIMKKSVIDLLKSESNISAIRGELLPYLVKKQFVQQKNTKVEDNGIVNDSVLAGDNSIDLHQSAEDEDMTGLAREMSTCWSSPGSYPREDGQIRCHAYLMPAGFCLRVNNLPTYCEANRQIPRQLSSLVAGKEVTLVHQAASIAQKSQVGSDSMVAEGVTIGEKVTVKKSIIGSHSNIGEKVKINNSIIMDHVKIKEGSVISGCVICENAEINEKCELKDCLIGNSQTIVPMGKFTNEVIVDIERMMEI